MSKFAQFMRSNKKEKKNEHYAPTASLVGSDGTPIRWEFKHIGSKENETIRNACTMEIQVTGKPGVYRPKVNTDQYLSKMIVAATVYPDLYDAELQDSYNVKTPEELLYALVDNAGEYQELTVWMQKFQGFTKSFDEKVDEAKN